MRWCVTVFAAVLSSFLGNAQAADTAPAAAPAAPTASASGGKLYTVMDGNKVDANTLKGWRTWRAMACERCHGANQEGMVGPSLIDSLKVLNKDQFKTTVLNGRVEKGMPNFGGSEQVAQNIDNLYAYLKGRSDGAIKPGRVEAMEK
jgi:mono/diheme cytochrome c family protein